MLEPVGPDSTQGDSPAPPAPPEPAARRPLVFRVCQDCGGPAAVLSSPALIASRHAPAAARQSARPASSGLGLVVPAADRVPAAGRTAGGRGGAGGRGAHGRAARRRRPGPRLGGGSRLGGG